MKRTQLFLATALFLLTVLASAETPTFQTKQVGPQNDRIAVKVYTDKSEYKVGEKMDISLKANADSYFMLYYVDSQGNAQVIVPSEFSSNNRLKKDALFHVKDNKGRMLEQKGPDGYERLQVIATKTPIKLSDLKDSVNPSTGEVYKPDVFIAQVTRSLSDRVEQKRGVGAQKDSAYGEFGMAEITYTVR